MRLIVGLGNPGAKYAETRHNAGFLFVDEVRVNLELPEFRIEKKWDAEVSEGQISNERVVILKPQTFMNLSGQSVATVTKFFKIAPEDILVVADNVDLPFGKVRMRIDGSAAGHNGVESIERELGTGEFAKLWIGIGPQPEKMKREDFVLGKLSLDEIGALPDQFSNGIIEIKKWLKK